MNSERSSTQVVSAVGGHPRSRPRRPPPPLVRPFLILFTVTFMGLFVGLPLLNVFYQALSKGIGAYFNALTTPESLHAVWMTIKIVVVAVPLNGLFGLAAAWVLRRYNFRGKTLLTTILDLPFSISPVIAGMLFVLLFGLQGYFGGWLRSMGLQVLFAYPGMLMATVFVTLPFVAREVMPVLEAQGPEEEEAGVILGASGWQMFRNITLPNIRWGLLYGLILCNARAVGDFGAVAVVSGKITGLTDTMPLRVEKLYQEYDTQAAFAVASLLACMAIATLGFKFALEARIEKKK